MLAMNSLGKEDAKRLKKILASVFDDDDPIQSCSFSLLIKKDEYLEKLGKELLFELEDNDPIIKFFLQFTSFCRGRMQEKKRVYER